MLIVAAEPFELQWITDPQGWRVHKVAGGPGLRLAGAAARRSGPAQVVISTGVCGALDPKLQVGDIFVASAVNDVACQVPWADVPFQSGKLVSQDQVAVTVDDKRSLANATGAAAVEMEAAAAAEYARETGARFYCIRAVSDTADESFPLDFNAARDEEGRFRINYILGQAMMRPLTAFPALMRLRRNALHASRALGEFFAHCRF